MGFDSCPPVLDAWDGLRSCPRVLTLRWGVVVVLPRDGRRLRGLEWRRVGSRGRRVAEGLDRLPEVYNQSNKLERK